MRVLWVTFLLFFSTLTASAQSLTLVELNCENLFDCKHDSLKQDTEWMPDGQRRWSPARYWRKLNCIGQEILSCQEEGIPDLVALVEVENDSVISDLTHRSLLRGAGYDYLMTESPDVRGIDVALVYQPFSFRPICYDYLTVTPLENMRPTRDILYVKGEIISGDTLHIFVVHAPSRYGGEKRTRPNRQLIADRLLSVIRQLPSDAKVIIAGDFNDDAASPALRFWETNGMHNVTAEAKGTHGAKATYRYQGVWQSIDHVFVSSILLDSVKQTYINDAPFLLEEDKKYGGVKPLRTFNGYRYQRGFSDHLPLVVRFSF
ncbi:Endonuclease/Exonuclease/phosphatase family protein [Prevotellaceae bacterium HUN156]|nr:Endonuclease/Exonuclease/phosphatase family protein [Prevotellaceae bacterium HUN156]